MFLQGGDNEVRVLIGKAGDHEEVYKELTVICGVTMDVAELALSIRPDKINIIVLRPVLHALKQSKLVDYTPLVPRGTSMFKYFAHEVSVVARFLMAS
jgi:hypothetical protein